MIIAIYARKSTEQIVATCSRCNRSYAVEAGRVQESVKKHEEGCRIFLDLEILRCPPAAIEPSIGLTHCAQINPSPDFVRLRVRSRTPIDHVRYFPSDQPSKGVMPGYTARPRKITRRSRSVAFRNIAETRTSIILGQAGCAFHFFVIGSRCSPEVFVVEPTHAWHLQHRALAWRLHAWLCRNVPAAPVREAAAYFRRQSENVRDASGSSACDPSIRRCRETAAALALERHQR
jgi:hypothetical protein